jgi:hypothetical protein
MTNDDVIALRVAVVTIAAAILEASGREPGARSVQHARGILDAAWLDATRPLPPVEYDTSGTIRVAAPLERASYPASVALVDRLTRKWAAELVAYSDLVESLNPALDSDNTFIHVNHERQALGLPLVSFDDFSPERT